jgi:hypothetical protein
MAGLPTRLRLALGAGLCALPLGLVWSANPGFLTAGYIIYGDCGYSVDEYCTTDTYIPGAYIPGSHAVGAQVGARVFLVFAALVLAYVAARPRTAATKRLTRAATAGIAAALALALAARAAPAAICLAGAFALTAPLVWRRPRNQGFLASGRRSR